jgi:hypothetical protein
MMTMPADDIEDEATWSQAASEQHSLTIDADKQRIQIADRCQLPLGPAFWPVSRP